QTLRPMTEIHGSPDSSLTGDAAFGQRNSKSAFRTIMRTLDQPLLNQRQHDGLKPQFQIVTQSGRQISFSTVDDLQVLARTQFVADGTYQVNDICCITEIL